MCVLLGGRGGAGRKLYVILGWDSGNCFNEMECSLFRTCLAETAMFCSVFFLGRASHTLPAFGKSRARGEHEQGGQRPPGTSSQFSMRILGWVLWMPVWESFSVSHGPSGLLQQQKSPIASRLYTEPEAA